RKASGPAPSAHQLGFPPLTGMVQSQIQSLGWQCTSQSIRPLDQAHPLGKSFLETELPSFLLILQPIEVEVPDLQRTTLIGLHQREGRAGHLFRAAFQTVDQGPRKTRLAGSQIALQSDHVTLLQRRRQKPSE